MQHVVETHKAIELSSDLVKLVVNSKRRTPEVSASAIFQPLLK